MSREATAVKPLGYRTVTPPHNNRPCPLTSRRLPGGHNAARPFVAPAQPCNQLIVHEGARTKAAKSRLTGRRGPEPVAGARGLSRRLLGIGADFEELRDGVHEALVVEIAHLLNLAVVVPDPGIQLLHEALVGVGLVIVNGPGEGREGVEK
ncbi:hypothetical protein EYF80_061816 [Liparis tanakae]|uniref:Uncharacterized protein n=1 Tax=Liparis tanakae TaxID=230148 RepID=A0A4Z2EGH7_9TELE|nr:hypothetical protein EYF80_061816 [Liparis tanakae]